MKSTKHQYLARHQDLAKQGNGTFITNTTFEREEMLLTFI